MSIFLLQRPFITSTTSKNKSFTGRRIVPPFRRETGEGKAQHGSQLRYCDEKKHLETLKKEREAYFIFDNAGDFSTSKHRVKIQEKSRCNPKQVQDEDPLQKEGYT